jgi:hypothetical protein
MIDRQSFQEWQQAPAQGITPRPSIMTDADELYLTEVITESRVRLESALTTAQRYGSQVPALSTALADAVTAVQQADAILSDLDTYAD